ncbi:MAG: hypothetical protein ABWY45_07710 [Mycobacterium sp.]
MTSKDSPRDDVPEADLAEQCTPVDDPTDVGEMDLSQLAVDVSDLIDASRTVELPVDDDAWRR